MSDLKVKAEAAIAEVEEWKAAGEHWPQWNRRYLEFRQEARPEDILALLAENESLRKDAERYRWLRSNQFDALEIMEKFVGEQMEYVTDEELDNAIDAAISSPENP